MPPARLARPGAATFWDMGEMLDSIPVPLQAVLWPLLGAALILILGRFLPIWLGRLAASAAAVASLAALWSLRAGTVGAVEILWEPLNLFRMSPSVNPSSLSLLVGITVALVTAAAVLGIRGSERQTTTWRALILVALAGCLVMTMAANLLTLAMGSALLDLALMALAVASPGEANRNAWRMAVPGLASTVLLVLSALHMDTQVGTASLLARQIPTRTLELVAIAGMLRIMIYPLHPRGLHTPENAVTLLLSANAGLYLVARTQTIAPVLADRPGLVIAGAAAMIAGGLLAWLGSLGPKAGRNDQPGVGPEHSESSPESWLAETWPGVAVHQTGYAFAFLMLVRASAPWPMISVMLALGIMAIWWDRSLERLSVQSGRFVQQLEAHWVDTRSRVTSRLPALGRWRGTPLGRDPAMLLLALAMASLVGLPLTVGARGRWPFYATLLHSGQTSLLIAVVMADTFLVAGLWVAAGGTGGRLGAHRPGPAAPLAMFTLAVPLIALGIAPGALDLSPAQMPGVSVWSLGLLYVLPWLLAALLVRVGRRVRSYQGLLRQILGLDWFYRAAAWAGQRLAGATYWLGQVGEGQGWWGWVLVILALGIMLLTIR